MKISFWDTGDYPILVNPTDQELIDFGKNEL